MGNLGPTGTLVDPSGDPVGVNGNPLVVSGATGGGATPSTTMESAIGTGAGVAVSVALPAVPGKSTICRGITITAAGGLNAVWGTVTLSDGTWTLTFQYAQTNGGNGSDMFGLSFGDGLLATNPNAAITLSCPAITSGGTVALSIWGGYQ